MWHEIFAGVYFCGLGIFFSFAETNLYVVKHECSVIVRWRDFIPSKLCYFKICFPRLSDFTDCAG